MFDNCVFPKASEQASIMLSSGKNVTVKNSIIAKSGASQINFGSIYINSSSGTYLYAAGQSSNASRSSWTDAQKLEALQTSSIDLSIGNTFTDDLTTGNALILID